MMTLFSIIVPTYNSERCISTCIASILAQKYKYFEILIIDGLSTDRTVELVRQFNDSRIHVFSEPDEGIYDAMNKGIEYVRGEWIYFLGSDDKFYNNEVLTNVAERVRATSSEVVYGDVYIKGDCSWASNGAIYDGEFSVAKLFNTNICHQAIFYSKNVFMKIGTFNARYSVCADWDFNHKCFAGCKVEYIKLTVAYFSAGGTSSQRHEDKFNVESVINLRKYHGITHFNSLFNTFGEIFLLNANIYFKEKKYFQSFYFFAVSLFHARSRLYYLKRYMWTIFSTIRNVAAFMAMSAIFIVVSKLGAA